jgi:hypothetical protein
LENNTVKDLTELIAQVRTPAHWKTKHQKLWSRSQRFRWSQPNRATRGTASRDLGNQESVGTRVDL